VRRRLRFFPNRGVLLILWFLAAIGGLVLTGISAWAAGRGRLAAWIGVSGAVLGSAFGIVASGRVLLGGTAPSLHLHWPLPLASFSIVIDPLSAFFLLPTFALSVLAAIYGFGYMKSAGGGASAGRSWLWFNLLVASMAMVIAARNGVLFLVAWELMTIASYFLVTTHDQHAEVRRAGRLYLIAAHVGTAFLVVMFLLLGSQGTLDFDTFPAGGSRAVAAANAIFILAICGFGVKAGFIPLHVWLPEAHPAAPAHVSALMSGIMIKLGIYGLLRTLSYLGEPPTWWGWLLVCIGLVSGILGVLYALAQHELKRLLAYHSIENIGIIAMGIGLGLIGLSRQSVILAAFGFGAALLHTLNHAIFKALLFLAAGALIRGMGTGEIERLGGLLKRMPWTGAAFLIGAIAISGLPPLNGFVSEFLLFLGASHAVAAPTLPVSIAGVALIAGLALIGGLAAACFAKAFGIVFLGEPRSPEAHGAREAPVLLRAPMLVLAGACVAIGVLSPWILPALARVLPAVAALPPVGIETELLGMRPALIGVTLIACAFLMSAILIAWLRALFLKSRPVRTAVTWDCGYARPTPRMQYTASSFTQPIMDLFAPMLGTRVSSVKPLGMFPRGASLETATPDSFRERVFRPIFRELDRILSQLRRIQEGRVQVYVLYIAITLLALLAYQFAQNP
jgi:formate hydrogenlyase subunit 3/multisubunit Na+/H+ antiporter MnhD subunit